MTRCGDPIEIGTRRYVPGSSIDLRQRRPAESHQTLVEFDRVAVRRGEPRQFEVDRVRRGRVAPTNRRIDVFGCEAKREARVRVADGMPHLELLAAVEPRRRTRVMERSTAASFLERTDAHPLDGEVGSLADAALGMFRSAPLGFDQRESARLVDESRAQSRPHGRDDAKISIAAIAHVPDPTARPPPGNATMLLAIVLLLALPTDHYAGWAYLHGGGDFPLRLRVTATDAATKPTVTIDSPAERQYEIATENVVATSVSIAFERTRANGTPTRFDLRVEGDALRGSMIVGGESVAAVELERSIEPIAAEPVDWFADCAGTYRADDGRALVVSRTGWGELDLVDLEAGIERALFPSGEDRFFAGAAHYVPSPVSMRVKFLRDGDDDVIALEREVDGVKTRFARVEHRERIVRFENAGLTLEGTLTLPPGDGPFPAIVLCGGSNWTTRVTLARQAKAFVALGLATFAFDQRGFGASSGPDPDDVSFEVVADDVAAAFAALRELDEIDPDRIGIFGASRGGWIAPLAHARGAKAAFCVLFVPPGVTPARQERSRRLAECALAGASVEQCALAADYLDALFACTTSDAAWERYAERRRAIADKKIGDRYWLDILWGPEDRESGNYKWQALNMLHDPIPVLERLDCPTLALLGERDHLVDPKENAPPMRAAFDRAAHGDASIVVIPRADHSLCPIGDAPIPLHRRIGWCPEVWRTVRGWLDDRGFVAK